jgi:2-keto-3-deoxy-L-rhamnonate aldolase RhmA
VIGERIRTFRTRLTAAAPLTGTFLKTPSPVICEVLAQAAVDVVCVDAEHAPFGRQELDACLAILRAADQPSLVRIAACTPADIRGALDCGATGILVPHVTSADQARAIVAAARFGEGGRGYSGSTRAADFGAKPMRDHIHDSHAQTVLIAQIEDPAALDAVGAIAAVEGIDCVFIGRADLAVAMGKELSAAEVDAAAARICSAGSAAGTAIGIFVANVSDATEISHWRAAGASLFLIGSDQGFVLAQAKRLAGIFHDRGREVR